MESLPNELIGRIFTACDREDRKALALVNRRFHYINKHCCGSRFLFHIRGRTEVALRKGLEHSFRTSHPFDHVRITRFNLKTHLRHDWFVNSEGYIPPDRCRQLQVRIVEFNECIVTDFTLACFRIVFPNMEEIYLKRSHLTSDPTRPDLKNLPSSPTHLNLFQLTVPFYADSQELMYNILENHFVAKRVKLPSSHISDKRWVNQQCNKICPMEKFVRKW